MITSDLSRLTDAELNDTQKQAFERQLRLMKGSWLIAILSGVGAILLLGGVLGILAGGISHGSSWLVIPGGLGVYLYYWEKGELRQNGDFLALVGKEIAARVQKMAKQTTAQAIGRDPATPPTK